MSGYNNNFQNSVIYKHKVMIDNALHNAGKPDKDKSLSAWQNRAIITRRALLKIKEEHQKEIQELKETYAPKVFEEKRQEPERIYSEVVKYAKEKMLTDLEETLAGKRTRYDESMSAPSEEDIRLLTALSMRTSLSQAEIAAVSGKFENRVQSLRVLKDIAQKHGILFPDVGDPDVFSEMMQRAEQFAKDKVMSIDTDSKDLSYKELLFWEHPDAGEARYFFGQLDGQGFTAEQISEATKREADRKEAAARVRDAGNGAEAGEMWAQVRCSGNQTLLNIASQFHVTPQQIRDANPGRDLSRLYSGDKIYVPSTRFVFQPDPSGGHVQPQDVTPVPRPKYETPTGPAGEQIGDDITVL